jgi:peptidoglycan/LPS O-acetylase OafA/YrhL
MPPSHDQVLDPSVASDPPARGRPHLLFLDGIRGLAALYVAIFHASSFVPSSSFAPPLRAVADCFRFGHLAVGVFIVLSGFCLMLPVVSSGQGQLPRGILTYLRRRAWRILPPYYAAFLLSAALLAIGLFLRGTGAVRGEALQSELTLGTVLSHLLMVHNLDFVWAHSINAPLWTVATEWQIYFVFPLLLLPVWRRFGRIAVVSFGLALGLAPVLLLPPAQSFWWAGPWYVGLFAQGMVAADWVLAGPRGSWRWLTAARASVAALAVVVVLCSLPHRIAPLWLIDIFVGFAAAGLIAQCAASSGAGGAVKASALVRVLQSPLLAGLGGFSYSLYLIHQPIQKGMLRLLQTLHLSNDLTLCLQLGVGMPLVIGLSYGFHRLFERPFILRNRGAGKVETREPPAAASAGARPLDHPELQEA